LLYMYKLFRLYLGFDAALLLLFIGTLMLSLLFGNGMLQLWHEAGTTWSEPVASLIATAFSWMSPTAAMVAFYVAWWIHTITILVFLVYIPQSKHAHLI